MPDYGLYVVQNVNINYMSVKEIVLIFLVIPMLLLELYIIINIAKQKLFKTRTKLILILITFIQPFIGYFVYRQVLSNYKTE